MLILKVKYQVMNWEDTRNNFEKTKKKLYPIEKAHIERFLNGTKVKEILTEDRTSAKTKVIYANFRKAVDSG